MNQLAILWTVHHLCQARSRFAFNCYRNWAQLLLHQPGDAPVIILSQEGVTHDDPLLMVLFRIIFVPLAEDLRDADSNLLSHFYAEKFVFDWLERQAQRNLKC